MHFPKARRKGAEAEDGPAPEAAADIFDMQNVSPATRPTVPTLEDTSSFKFPPEIMHVTNFRLRSLTV